MRFEKLLSPIQIKNVKLKNRMVKAPQLTNYVEKDGYITERIKDTYEALAKGGVGMIILGGVQIDSTPTGLNMPGIWDDSLISGLSALVQVIHKHNCPIFAQLGHQGPGAIQKITGIQPISSSSLTPDEMPFLYYSPPRGLTISEIEILKGEFIDAAARAKKAGFDGVEVHAVNSYLLASFLSRAWNKRQDAYGCQDLRNRARIVVEIIQGTKEYLGQDYAVGVRINGQEWGTKNGITSEESQGIARILEEAGADYISVAGFGYGEQYWRFLPDYSLYPEPTEEIKPLAKKIRKQGLFAPATEAIKKVVSVPVMGVGRLDPVLGERLLQEGKADLILLGRRLFADPELPNKVASGRIEDIVPCTACGTCETPRTGPRRCRINASLGREREYRIKPAEKKKRVMVVGSGPAGMEAARVSASRGHEVFLYEKGPKLGGLLPLAALVKGTAIEALPAITRYFKVQLSKLGVKIRLGKEVTSRVVEEIKPDVVIVATGGTPTVPKIPGINRPNVISSEELHRRAKGFLRFFGPEVLRWFTKFYLPIGKKVVIVGGTMHGCEVAEFLIKRGREVTIVEESDKLGAGMSDRNLDLFIPWLAKRGVRTLTQVRYEEVTDKGLIITTKEGKRQTLEADTILVSVPPKPNTEFFKDLERKVPEVFMIGDCKEPKLIVDAVADGSYIGRTI